MVSDGASVLADAAEAGDEPVMLARALPGVVVAVGARRDAVGRAVEARFGRRVHVLDDGFQHLRLRARPRPRVPRRARPRGPAAARGPPARAARGPRARRPRPAHAPRGGVRGRAARPRARSWARTATLRVERRVAGWTTLDGAAGAAPARAFLLPAIARPERFAGATSRGAAPPSSAARSSPTTTASAAARRRAAVAARGAGRRRRRPRHHRQGRGAPRAAPGSGLPVVVLRDRAPRSRTRRASARGCWRPRGGPGVTRERRYALEAALAAIASRGGPAAAAPRGAGARAAARAALGRARPRATCAIAADNLRRAFPEWDEARVQAHGARRLRALRRRVLLDILWMEGRPPRSCSRWPRSRASST